jgi:hypothetical protein
MAEKKANFSTIPRSGIPHRRKGKHNLIVGEILDNLARLEKGNAIKIPLRHLNESKERVRSALNRATRKANMRVATAADDEFLYVWNVD